MRTIHAVPVREFADLKWFTSKIQDAKRAAIEGQPSRWPDRLPEEFAKLEEASVQNPYAALDIEYLRDRSYSNRSFAYVNTYDTFVSPGRDASGCPAGEPAFVSVVKLGDGGREDGRSAGKASGSIISRTVRSYWEEENVYSAVLHGVVIPGNDSNISSKIANELGGWELRIKGDLWHAGLLDRLKVEELLQLMEAGAPPVMR
ncbi:MAG: hypothetical protein H0V79_03765 [Actinobacteria bacterium]|nr:hypothetical protein [Actinomycetota bacterium]